MDVTQDFLALAVEKEVLKFGSFELKSGRISPYFFNAGLFDDGDSLHRLGRYYAQAIRASGLEFDMLYGPAYKGIPLATCIAVAFAADHGRNLPVCFNRKEAKAHGEGGELIGAPLRGKVLIVDDVVSAGTSVRESLAMIERHGAHAVGIAVALDRQESGPGGRSAIAGLCQDHALQAVSIANLDALLAYLANGDAEVLAAVQAYRTQYGA